MDNDNQSERMDTTIVKGPDGKSRIIKLRRRKQSSKKKRVNEEEDRGSVASLYHSRSRPQVGQNYGEQQVALKPTLNNVTSRKRLSAEEELERERKARLDLEKDLEELKRKNHILSDQILFSKIQTAKQFTAARLYSKDVLYVVRKQNPCEIR